MRELLYSAATRRDIADIARYIARESASLATAMAFTDALDNHCRKLARLPGTLGRARPELRPDIRSIPYRGYVIFFRYRPDQVEIVNILEGHRDIGSHLGDD